MNHDAVPELSSQSSRRVSAGQMLFLAALFTLAAVVNGYSVATDRARSGNSLPLWQPMVWEFSSHLLIWLLVPAVAWWLARFSLGPRRRIAGVCAHLLATVPFSLMHTAGMVLLRKAAYAMVGETYEFGPFWTNWPYEYRKDLVTYCLVVGAILACRVYALSLEQRRQPSAPAPVPGASPQPIDRLVVRKRNREFILETGAIDRIEADGNYVIVHAEGETYRRRESLDALARRLGEQRFARVHRTHVVNIDRIHEIQPWEHGDHRIVLKDGSFLNFSRRYRSRLTHLFR